MKKLIFFALIFLGAAQFMMAQEATNDVTIKDYERMLQAQYEMDFRNYAIKTLGLTSDEIEAFDPIYRRYMDAKNDLAEKRFHELEEYTEEMKEDDRLQDELNETADFIEDYWEIQIAEMELAKDYFDILEDKIGVDNAFGFFLLEDMIANDVQKTIVEKRYIPIYIEKDVDSDNSTGSTTIRNYSNEKKSTPTATNVSRYEASKKYRQDIDTYSNWVKGGKGKVTLDHDYTRDGLHALANAIVALSEAVDIEENMDYEAQTIKAKADKLQIDRSSDMHADWTREAFIMAADMLETIQSQGEFTSCRQEVGHVVAAAKKIDASELMTPQAEHIYDFFEKAQAAINEMANNVSWASR